MRLYTPYSLSRGAPSATRSRFRNDVIVTCFFAGFGKTMILFRLVETDRKSTRLNSSHLVISYAVFCLKKKKNIRMDCRRYIYLLCSWHLLPSFISFGMLCVVVAT